MRNGTFSAVVLAVLFGGVMSLGAQQKEPPVVTTGPGMAPSDAIVLFDGKGLDKWQTQDGKPAAWKVADGAATVTGGDIMTRQKFGDIQLHLEFASPTPATGTGQDRGNSGIYLGNRYEVQVLDSYKNETYIDGMLGAVYKVSAPLVNACRKPSEWQTYDIVFRPPRFDSAGKKTADAVVTVILNGVLVQDHLAIPHPTGGREDAPEMADGPILLQDHHHPVRYRNIWVRELK